jgi:serine/threonine protein kinase
MVGTTISHYRVLEKIGEGGMGEVYLAEDSRLDRKVALKILPEHLSERADLRERFERDARAVSSLNHPHICTLHDIGEQDGIHFLVMEHLEGETLVDRLEKGASPLYRPWRWQPPDLPGPGELPDDYQKLFHSSDTSPTEERTGRNR